MLVAGQIALLIAFCLGLVKSTEFIISAIKKIARRSGLGSFGLTAFVLALATSLPEVVVGITASIEGLSPVVLGNVLGSNIADISLVVGGAAIAAGTLRVTGDTLRRDLWLTFAAALLPLLLIGDLVLSRADGVVLLTVYIMLVTTFLKKHTQAIGSHAMEEEPIKRLLVSVSRRSGRADLLHFTLGVGGLLISSHMIVQLSKEIATGLGLPLLLIGLLLVAVGTSLPELAFEMRAVREGHIAMAFGDLLGSVVANSTLVLGIAALIRPINLGGNGGLTPYAVAIAAFVVLYLLLLYFAHSKSRLERWEAMILLLTYFGFIILELGRA